MLSLLAYSDAIRQTNVTVALEPLDLRVGSPAGLTVKDDRVPRVHVDDVLGRVDEIGRGMDVQMVPRAILHQVQNITHES